VHLTDLRESIEEWEKDGTVLVKGRKSASEVLKRECGHLLTFANQQCLCKEASVRAAAAPDVFEGFEHCIRAWAAAHATLLRL
jgi:hypothetical protein